MGKDAIIESPIKKKADSHATLVSDTIKTVTLKPKAVKWVDACYIYVDPNNTVSFEEAQDLEGAIRHTVGFVLKEDKDYLILAMDYSEYAEGYSKIIVIPASCVIKDSD